MSVTSPQTVLTPDLESACLQLDAIAALLQCADPERWDSLARPGPDGLAAVLFRVGAEMRAGAADLVRRTAA